MSLHYLKITFICVFTVSPCLTNFCKNINEISINYVILYEGGSVQVCMTGLSQRGVWHCMISGKNLFKVRLLWQVYNRGRGLKLVRVLSFSVPIPSQIHLWLQGAQALCWFVKLKLSVFSLFFLSIRCGNNFLFIKLRPWVSTF